MSEAWWGREAEIDSRARILDDGQPELVDASAQAVRAAIQARLADFTPEWTNLARDDAGVALVRLFGLQMEPVLRRVNRLPEKIFIEHLRIAGVSQLPATAATALLQFTISPAAGGSVLVPAGFQVGAEPATGQGDQVTFETERAIHASPATVTDVVVEEAGLLTEVASDGPPFRAFGARPRPGNALWIGLTAPAGVAAPAPAVSLGIVIAAGDSPAPASSGGIAPPPVPPAPLLQWELLDGARIVPLDLQRDETSGLGSTGVLELGLPRSWRSGRLPAGPGLPERLWLRVRLAHGDYAVPPVVAAVRANVTRAHAYRTIRDEVLERLPESPSDRQVRMRVSQTPVLPRSLVIEVQDDPGGDVFGTGTPEPGPLPAWQEVDNLSGYGPDARVFVLDSGTGVVTFGDGIHGARIPPGFRNVRAVVYRAGGGAAGRAGADAITAPLTSVPFVSGVTNPFPASGGVDTEPDVDAVRRGPAELRSGGRAVTPADYALLARRAPGAEVARAHGVVGLHPEFPGAPIPGVVGVLIVGADRGSANPPLPREADLRSVTAFLVREAAPVGVHVVAAAPRFHSIAVEARVVLAPDEDQADLIRRAIAALDSYLHPLTGGDAGTGWPFGATVRHVALVRRLLTVDGVLAVPQLNVVIDGLRQQPCVDQPIAAHALVWPARHELLPVTA